MLEWNHRRRLIARQPYLSPLSTFFHTRFFILDKRVFTMLSYIHVAANGRSVGPTLVTLLLKSGAF
jgi:hypothetical protein